MERLTFDQLCTGIPDKIFSSLLEEVIKGTDKKLLLKNYAVDVSNHFKGFRNIQSVPLALICRKLKDDSKSDLIVAQTVLSNWYRINANLVNRVKGQLNKLKYTINEPDFDSVGVEVSILKEIHSLSIDSKSYSNIFDEDLNESDRLKITLINVLLGWYPATVKEEEHSIEPYNQKVEPIELKNFEDKMSINIDIQIEKLLQLKLEYLNLKEQIVTYLDKFKNLIVKGQLFNNYGELSDQYNAFAKLIFGLEEQCDSISKYFISHNDSFSIEKFIKTDDKLSLNQKIDYLESYYKLLVNHYDNLYSKHSNTITELVLQLEQDYRELIEIRLKEIGDKYKNRITVEHSSEILDEFNSLIVQITEEISSYDFNEALSKIISSPSERSEKYIIEYFKNHGNQIDCLTLFLLLLPDRVILSEKTINYLLNHFIDYLSKTSEDDFQFYLLEEKIYSKLSKHKLGNSFIALSACFLYLLGEKERASARLFTDDVYSSLSNSKSIEKLFEKILSNEDFEFYNSKSEEIEKMENELNGYFNKGTNYSDLFTGIENKFRNVCESKMLSILHTKFENAKSKAIHELQKIEEELSKNGYCEDLYYSNKSNLPKNTALERKIIKILEKITNELLEFVKMELHELKFRNNNFIPYEESINGLNELFHINPNLEPIKKKLIEKINFYRTKDNKVETLADWTLDSKVIDNLLNSKFYSLHCPTISIKANSQKVTCDEILQDLLEDFSEDLKYEVTFDRLYEKKVTKSLEFLQEHLDPQSLNKFKGLQTEIDNELLVLESKVQSMNKVVPKEYNVLKRQERWSLCKDILNDLVNKSVEEQKKSSEIIAQTLQALAMRSAQLRISVNQDRGSYTDKTLLTLFEGLRIVDEISNYKQENNIHLAEAIIKEIEQLRQFKNETIDQLNILIGEFKEGPASVGINEYQYLQLNLTDILKNIANDDYSSLGLNKKQWGEISSERKEYISELIESWNYLSDKPTTKDDIIKSKLNFEEIETECKKLVISLCSICSLYKTNDNKKIGQEPLGDWHYSLDLPFVYTTKIQSPRCSSLDRPIRFYIITQEQLSSKKYINRIKDFINEKKYDLTGFNVLILLGSREKFSQINTNSTTKSLPILDDLALKRILFSTAEKKIPKWEFVFLLTLNKKISSIQPFKTQGSVDSNTGIFVGRNDIIKEIIGSQKDYAIYGGRKIGKSSLLSVVRNSLSDNGYKVSYQSFQGIDNSIVIAKLIVEDLKARKLNYTALINMETLDDFSQNLLTFYRENDNQKIAIILDEMDELIHKEKKIGRHQIVEVFRNISQKTNHLWRFIFAGYKEMYMEIQGKGTYTYWKNPWQNFVDDSNMQLTEIESPRELIDEGLKDILGLEYDKEIIDSIANYSTGHPAFLQKFCECLVKSIDNRISPENRRIYKKDVVDVFEKDTEFIRYVKSTLDSNLSDIQELITIIAAIENKETFTQEWVREKLEEWIETFDIELKIDSQKLELEIELLTITGVVKRTNNRNEYKFTHPHFVVIIKKLESVDKNLVENLINKIKCSNETTNI